MPVAHSALTGANLHEPKGIAAADDNQVYISDGAGSGAWTSFPTGWAYYKDNAAAQTFTTTAAALSIDGLHADTEKSYLPPEIRGSGDLWNTTTDRITPITIGDTYDIRVDLPVTAEATSPSYLFWDLDIGSGSTNIVAAGLLNLTKTPPYELSIALPIFTLTTFVTNGGRLLLSTDAGTVDITSPSVFISRNHAGGI